MDLGDFGAECSVSHGCLLRKWHPRPDARRTILLVGRWVLPIVRGFDLCFDAGMLGEEMQEVATAEELEWLALRKVERGVTVAAGGDQDALGRTFILHRAVEVANGAHTDGVLVALGLDNYLA